MSNPTRTDLAAQFREFEPWQKVPGSSRRSGPEYTVWRDWSEEDWIDGIVHYDSYNGGEEVVPCVVVGVYLDAQEEVVLGILVQKRLQDGLKDRFLIPLAKLLGLIDLTNGRAVAGDPSALIHELLMALDARLASVASASPGVRASARKYVGEVGSLIKGAFEVGVSLDKRTEALLADLLLRAG